MRNIKLTICYDGSDFFGWQFQPGQPTIQGALAEVAEKLTQHRVQVFGAGRTDAGVHALGQVAHFRTPSTLTAGDFKRAFNALLPAAVRILDAEEVGPDFHARFQAIAKTYQYRIYRGPVLPPFERRYVLHDPFPLNVSAMAEAARLFEGEHDFTSWGASTGSEEGDKDRTPIREIFSSRLHSRTMGPVAGQGFLTQICTGEPAEDAGELLYVVRGKSFLRYMVRKIVGTLLDVGRGKLRVDEIPALFEMRDRSKSGPTVPPQGLYLASVEYSETWKW
ncbi:MAG TPA: tRNA pseudouridine(38-40) synthase TruA [Candidatus Acidoferrales bacterium]|nr:tRNA pseudouridine(38-40) synthase TruA [Candidatus Acidoferrales bacterium]